jgi:NNP family nitrate/nitrite transporter-like MFS transporter
LPFRKTPLLFLVLIFYLNFTCRVVLSPLLPILEREFGLGHGEAGSLFLFMQVGYCAGLLASGFVSCRWNHRRTILLSTATLGLLLLLTSRSTSIAAMRAWLVLLGTAAGLYLPAGIATITRETSQEHWGKALAIHELAPNLGFITAPLLAQALLQVLPWRGILAVLGLLAILVGAGFRLFGRGGVHKSEPPRVRTMSQLASDSSLWIAALLFSVSIGSGLGLYTMMPLFLMTEVGMGQGLANTITGLSRVPSIAVIFISGMITDRIGHRRALILFLGATGALTLVLGLAHGHVMTSVLIFLQATAAVCFFPAGFSMVSAISPPNQRTLAVSVVTITGSLLGGGVIPTAIGYLAEASSFSSSLCLLGILTMSMLPLLRRSRTSRSGDSAPGRTGRP